MTIDPFSKLIDHLESEVNWKKIFGVVDSVYSDDGFTTNADNFTRATTIEKAIAKFSDLKRVDQTGYDFVFDNERVELKMGKKLFYKRDNDATKKFKVKSFLSEKKDLEDYRRDKTFDYMMVIDLTSRRVVIVEDERARSLYELGADGAMIRLKLGDYYQCDIGELTDLTPIMPKQTLSEQLKKTIDNYLDF